MYIYEKASYIINMMNLETVAGRKKKKDNRCYYLKELVIALVMSQVIERAGNKKVWQTNFSTKSGLESILGRQLVSLEVERAGQAAQRDFQGKVKELGKCGYCIGRRSARKQCYVCKKLICASHTSAYIGFCVNCPNETKTNSNS